MALLPHRGSLRRAGLSRRLWRARDLAVELRRWHGKLGKRSVPDLDIGVRLCNSNLDYRVDRGCSARGVVGNRSFAAVAFSKASRFPVIAIAAIASITKPPNQNQ